jgi:hypothetical protein
MFAPGEKGKGTLHINIKQAKELPKMNPNGLTDGLVKCHLLPDKSAKGKRKTGVIKNNLNPVWEERFTYEKVALEELSKERVLEACVCHNDPKGNNIVIGGVRLGSAPSTASKHKEWMDSIGDEVSHWEAMLTHPGEWVDRWHTLRHSMDPRSVDLTIPPSGSTSSFQHPTHVDLTVPSKVEGQSTKLEVTAPAIVDTEESSKPTPEVVSQPPASLQAKPEPSPTEISLSIPVEPQPSVTEVSQPVQVKHEISQPQPSVQLVSKNRSPPEVATQPRVLLEAVSSEPTEVEVFEEHV